MKSNYNYHTILSIHLPILRVILIIQKKNFLRLCLKNTPNYSEQNLNVRKIAFRLFITVQYFSVAFMRWQCCSSRVPVYKFRFSRVRAFFLFLKIEILSSYFKVMDGLPAGYSDCESDDYFMDEEAPAPLPTFRSRPNNKPILKVLKSTILMGFRIILIFFVCSELYSSLLSKMK